MYETIVYEVGDRIAHITLNRPEARNALNDVMIEELLDAFGRAKADDEVRVIVLTGVGDRAFCAGADLGGADRARRAGRSIAGVDGTGRSIAGVDAQDTGAPTGDGADGPAPATGAIRASAPYRLFTAFPRLGKPIIARLAGHAIAGGLGLAASCDLVIAAEDVKLGTPEVNVGLWPMMIMAIINRNVAPKQAFKLYYTGQTISAREGVQVGLVTEAVPRDRLDARVDELARTIAAKSPVGLRHGRDAFFAIDGLPFDDQIAHLLGQLVVVGATEDAKEGITAFLEKRSPEFTGR
ncbi:enoyl-CoA hydratase/isomerase family protein [Actinomadura alba]|uniref:Enoyl-CoA hydratase/isomerase family protein n=1 Tax=Actinomadura alba TaxID=406431 RepID=A0ABR7LM52_9ACTN|nr:enoyl-CoA hydratase-related protein [Actinomadura alba]MBC6465674.1 enoyl-CoA hydratase/isomerase family protein [Actinomadura alba]